MFSTIFFREILKKYSVFSEYIFETTKFDLCNTYRHYKIIHDYFQLFEDEALLKHHFIAYKSLTILDVGDTVNDVVEAVHDEVRTNPLTANLSYGVWQ